MPTETGVFLTLSNLDCSMYTCTTTTYWLGGPGHVTSRLQPQLSSSLRSPGPLLTLMLKVGLQGSHFQEPSDQVQSFTSVAL